MSAQERKLSEHFLEDFTVKVIEHKVVNSGMMQGTWLQRKRVFRQGSAEYIRDNDLYRLVDPTGVRRK